MMHITGARNSLIPTGHTFSIFIGFGEQSIVSVCAIKVHLTEHSLIFHVFNGNSINVEILAHALASSGQF
jgi:hypothetical protein